MAAKHTQTKNPTRPQAPQAVAPPPAPPAVTSPAPPRERTPEEQALVNAFFARTLASPLPKAKMKGEAITPAKDDDILWIARIASIMKIYDYDLLLRLVSQGARCFVGSGIDLSFNDTLAAVAGLAPRDPLESVLAVQMISVHNAAMEFLRRALLDKQTIDGINIGTKRATALFNVFAKQMDTLMRYRGGGKQTVVVQHVQVDAGGQAIVGTVNHSSSQPGGGRDDTQK